MLFEYLLVTGPIWFIENYFSLFYDINKRYVKLNYMRLGFFRLG